MSGSFESARLPRSAESSGSTWAGTECVGGARRFSRVEHTRALTCAMTLSGHCPSSKAIQRSAELRREDVGNAKEHV